MSPQRTAAEPVLLVPQVSSYLRYEDEGPRVSRTGEHWSRRQMNHLTDYKHRVSSIEHPASPLTHSPIHKIRDTSLLFNSNPITKRAKMNVTKALTKAYENIRPPSPPKANPKQTQFNPIQTNSNPIKPNLRDDQMNVITVLTMNFFNKFTRFCPPNGRSLLPEGSPPFRALWQRNLGLRVCRRCCRLRRNLLLFSVWKQKT